MYERFLQLITEFNITPYRLSKETGITQTTFSDWKNGKAIPKINKLQKIAAYFDVQVEWLIGNTEFRTKKEELNSAGLLHIPEDLKDVQVAFHRGEFEDLTQDEVDALAVIARTLKEQRKKKEKSNS
jgi:Helix-turn-helix.